MSKERFEPHHFEPPKDHLISSLGDALCVGEGVGDWGITFDKMSLTDIVKFFSLEYKTFAPFI